MHMVVVSFLSRKNHKVRKIDPSLYKLREQDAAYEISSLPNKEGVCVCPSFYFQPEI